MSADDTGFQTVPGSQKANDAGVELEQKYVDGKKQVADIGETITADREFGALHATRQSASWANDTLMKRIKVNVLSEPPGAGQWPAAIAMCFDAPTDALADSWLTAGAHTSDDAQSRKILVGETKTFDFLYGLTRVDAKRIYGSEALRISIEAEDEQ